MSDHERIDRQVAAMHKIIAERLRAGDLAPLDRARSNLERWQQQFGGVLPPAYLEWSRSSTPVWTQCFGHSKAAQRIPLAFAAAHRSPVCSVLVNAGRS